MKKSDCTCKGDGYICPYCVDMLDQGLTEYATKVKELEAQLARCVGAIIASEQFSPSFIESLPKTAHFDAEVLRCAGELDSLQVSGFCDDEIQEWNNKITELGEAVRAKKED